MTDSNEIRRHANGSIDTSFYTRIGRQRRSEALYLGGHAIACFGSAVARAVGRIRSRPATRRSAIAFAKI